MLWKEPYDQVTSRFRKTEAPPLIGITGNYADQNCTLAAGYYRSVLLAGGIPLIIPPFVPDTEARVEALGQLLDRLDGLLLSGGGDINPLLLDEEPLPQLHSVNPERDAQELLLARLAYDRQLPILGICKGLQTLVAALDGQNYQDLWTQAPQPSVKHSQDQPRETASHTAHVEADSLLHDIYGRERLAVNSFHHQAVKVPGPHLRVCATATDGIIEAVESSEHKPLLGVQWHPEHLAEGVPLFEWLVGEARLFQRAKDIHASVVTLDSHCDTPMQFDVKTDFGQRDDRVLVDLHKMTEGRLDVSCMVAYLPQGPRDEQSLRRATERAHRILSQIEEMVQRHADCVALAYTPDDIARLKAQGLKAIVPAIENGYAIGCDVANVEAFRRRGVAYMTLCHNGDNDICGSARGEGLGVSAFGAEVIAEMNRVGMMVDLSHASERSFYDALDISRQPIVCTHSSAKALCNHPRNLSDDQMRALARKGGVMQVTLYHGFLRPDPEPATVLDALQHLRHAISVMGIEHVGIGTDFDGDGGVPGCAHAAELLNLTRLLLRERYSAQDLRLIWGGNFLRVMAQVQAAGAIQPTTTNN